MFEFIYFFLIVSLKSRVKIFFKRFLFYGAIWRLIVFKVSNCFPCGRTKISCSLKIERTKAISNRTLFLNSIAAIVFEVSFCVEKMYFCEFLDFRCVFCSSLVGIRPCLACVKKMLFWVNSSYFGIGLFHYLFMCTVVGYFCLFLLLAAVQNLNTEWKM